MDGLGSDWKGPVRYGSLGKDQHGRPGYGGLWTGAARQSRMVLVGRGRSWLVSVGNGLAVWDW